VAMIGQKGFPPIHGGIEKHVAELAARLGSDGFAVDLYSRPHYSRANGPTDLPGVRVKRLPSIPTKHLDAITHTFLATLHSLFQKYDIVHYHALGPGLLSGVPRWFSGARTVVTVHGLDWQRDKWGGFARSVLKMGEAASVTFPHRTVVVSKALRDYYLEQHKQATTYIPNGIVPPEYRPRELLYGHDVDKPFVLFVGRLVPEKGCHFLLDAWGRLPAEIRSAHQLVIAGDAGFTPGYVESLRKAAPPGVVFLGYVHGPVLEELFSEAEIMVLPSTLEGLSITLLEGMSYGRCCLVSDIPPNLEAAGGFAKVFESGNVGMLRDCLAELLADPGQRDKLGREGQIHAIENYSWNRVAGMTADLYREVVCE
jgi:glycosyltransferase involved in cell wall biosynthesis